MVNLRSRSVGSFSKIQRRELKYSLSWNNETQNNRCLKPNDDWTNAPWDIKHSVQSVFKYNLHFLLITQKQRLFLLKYYYAVHTYYLLLFVIVIILQLF